MNENFSIQLTSKIQQNLDLQNKKRKIENLILQMQMQHSIDLIKTIYKLMGIF